MISFGFEIAGGIIAGIIIGYNLDKFFGTKPIGIIVCLILSIFGAILNYYKLIKGIKR